MKLLFLGPEQDLKPELCQKSKKNILKYLSAQSADNQLKVLGQEQCWKKTDNKIFKKRTAKIYLRNERGGETPGEHYILLARNESWLMSIELVPVIPLCHDGEKARGLEENYAW